MAILVTGGAGYIGSHMAWALSDAGEKVVIVDNFSTGFQFLVPPESKIYEMDIADQDGIGRIVREHSIEAIIHFAGSAVVPDSVRAPLFYYENNTAKSRDLLDSAIRSGVKYFVFSSTAAVYGTPNHGDPVTETQPLDPESPYGSSKLMTEIMLRDAAAAHDFTYTALRYFNVAGADDRRRTGQSTAAATHLIKAACAAATGSRSHIDVFGTDYPTPDGTCIRDYIHVSDLVDAHILALHRMREGGPSLIANCGYGHGYSVLEVIDAVKRASGFSFPVRHAARRPGDAVSIIADPSIAKRELGWRPTRDNLDQIVQSALEWEQHLLRKNSAKFD